MHCDGSWMVSPFLCTVFIPLLLLPPPGHPLWSQDTHQHPPLLLAAHRRSLFVHQQRATLRRERQREWERGGRVTMDHTLHNADGWIVLTVMAATIVLPVSVCAREYLYDALELRTGWGWIFALPPFYLFFSDHPFFFNFFVSFFFTPTSTTHTTHPTLPPSPSPPTFLYCRGFRGVIKEVCEQMYNNTVDREIFICRNFHPLKFRLVLFLSLEYTDENRMCRN